MHKMEELRKMLCDELEDTTKRGELNPSSLDAIDKLTHSIKSIDTIMAMAGYSNEGSYGHSYEGSYARGRNARRDSMGRYSKDAGSYGDGSYARGSYEQGYSREAKEDLEMELRQMKAKNPEASHMIDMWMDQLSRN